MSETLKEIEKFKRSKLKDLLDQCTKPQQLFFVRLYPGGFKDVPEEKIPRAIQQCEATITKNKEKGIEL